MLGRQLSILAVAAVLTACNPTFSNRAIVYPPVSGLFDINWRLSVAGVTSVEFFVDDRSLGTDSDASNGFSMEFDSSTVPNGLHRMRAVAKNAAGQTVGTVEHTLSIEN